MSAKDIIIFGVLVVLVGVAVYFQFMATDMITPVSYTHLTLPTNREV